MLKKSGIKKKIINDYMYTYSLHLIDYIRFFCRGKLISIKNINLLNNKPKILISKMKFASGDSAIYTSVYDVISPWYVVIKANKKIIAMKPLEHFFFQTKKKFMTKGSTQLIKSLNQD